MRPYAKRKSNFKFEFIFPCGLKEVIDYSKLPLSKRISKEALDILSRYWGKENREVTAKCPPK